MSYVEVMLTDALLGTPQIPTVDDVANVSVSRIGGNILLFRSTNQNPVDFFICPSCQSFDNVSLLSQIFSPDGCNDRILYILTCSKCSTSSEPSNPVNQKMHKKNDSLRRTESLLSYCFAIRSQNFNKQRYEAKLKEFSLCTEELLSKAHERKSMFEVNTEWGESDEILYNEVNIEMCEKPEEVKVFSEKLEEEFSLERCNPTLKLTCGRKYTEGIPLDIIEEELRETQSIQEEFTKKFGDLSRLIEQGDDEVDDTAKQDKWIENYMSRIENNPSQCVRWNRGGKPLRTSLEDLNVPPCSSCGAERHFELQLTAPIIYFLTKDLGEVNNKFLHFSNVLVFTCSANCNSKGSPYLREFVITEKEV